MFPICNALLFVFLHISMALTPDEVAAFGTSGCTGKWKSTNNKQLCGKITITTDGDNHIIETNSVPSSPRHQKRMLQDYLYRDAIHGFCLPIVEQKEKWTVPVNPVKHDTPGCVPYWAGIALDGVEIWNQYNPEFLVNAMPEFKDVLKTAPPGTDAGKGYAGEPVDGCSGHPAPHPTSYHYHKLPAFGESWGSVCFGNETAGEPSGILGIAQDGFPIYGPYDVNGKELTPADLDECNGHEVDGKYRYIITDAYPYGPGCLWGKYDKNNLAENSFPLVNDAPLCWKSSDYLSFMEKTNYTLYSDCNKWPAPESNGVKGCMSYLANPALYVASGMGSMKDFDRVYQNTCPGNVPILPTDEDF